MQPDTMQSHKQRLADKVHREEMLADVKTVLRTILYTSITITKEFIYTTGTVILEALGYKVEDGCSESPLWRKRLESKMREPRRMLVS